MPKNKRNFFEKLKRVITVGNKQASALELEETDIDDLKEETILEDFFSKATFWVGCTFSFINSVSINYLEVSYNFWSSKS